VRYNERDTFSIVVNEELAEPQVAEEPVEVSTPPPVPEPVLTEAATPPPMPPTPPVWLRLAYTLEFLLAIDAALSLWSQVGGQGHLDLLPWYSKLILVTALAWCVVGFTISLVDQPHVWTGRTVRWFSGMLLVALAMGLITFWYHLHEVTDDQDTGDTTSTSVSIARPGGSLKPA
jgi:hypothetical protein